jgi:hypothetical protein
MEASVYCIVDRNRIGYESNTCQYYIAAVCSSWDQSEMNKWAVLALVQLCCAASLAEAPPTPDLTERVGCALT